MTKKEENKKPVKKSTVKDKKPKSIKEVADARKIGRPSQYKSEYAEQAKRLALLGLTDKEMAPIFNVCDATFSAWKNEHPEFLESLREGKLNADVKVTESLYKLALGAKVVEQDWKLVDGQMKLYETVKEYPPNFAAANKWLSCRRRGLWTDKVEEKPQISEELLNKSVKDMTAEELEAVHRWVNS